MTTTCHLFVQQSPGRVATTRALTYGESTAALAGKSHGDVAALAAGKSYGEVARTVGIGAAFVLGEADTAPTYAPVEVQFKATWGDHEIRLEQAPADGAATHFDRVELTRLAYSAPVPHIRPNRPVRLVTAIGREPIWSGVTNDIDSTYSLNKDTGEMTTFVNLSAVDAVAPLVGTTRYGAVIEGGVQSETWANRINRLALSAPAGVDVEPVDARLEMTVYEL